MINMLRAPTKESDTYGSERKEQSLQVLPLAIIPHIMSLFVFGLCLMFDQAIIITSTSRC